MTNTLTKEQKLWLACELGLQLDLRSSVVHYYPVINGIAQPSIPLDLESDTPDAAYLREKVVEWLLRQSVIVTGYGDYWIFGWISFEACDYAPKHETTTRTKAILAAVQWLYERRNG